MIIYYEHCNCYRFEIEIDSRDITILELKNLIQEAIDCTCTNAADRRLVFNGYDLNNSKLVKDYTLRHESVICFRIPAGGGSLYKNDLMRGDANAKIAGFKPLGCGCDERRLKKALLKDSKIQLLLDGKQNAADKQADLFIDDGDCITFRPLTDYAQIPFYKFVCRFTELAPDRSNYYIAKLQRYTTGAYLAPKVQAFTLNLDIELQDFYTSLWFAILNLKHTQLLPKAVYHICTMTPTSWDFYSHGFEFIYPAFMSTTTCQDLPWRGNTLWEIDLSSIESSRIYALSIAQWSKYPEQDEVLISCCRRFQVVAKVLHYSERFLYYMKLKYIE